MKHNSGLRPIWFTVILSVLLQAPGLLAQKAPVPENNDFYDNVPFKALPINQIEITGEVSKPGLADLSQMPLHQVQVREAKLDKNKTIFIGAYVYQGYSLFDILKDQIIQKQNEKEFSSPIDLLIIIENKAGEKVIFSWGEVFYPINLHRIIIAARVAPIIPSATGETWPLPEESKVVAANDLYAERNIQSPVRIIVHSCPLSKPVLKGKSRLYSENIKLIRAEQELAKIGSLPGNLPVLVLPTVFFGRGRGFHGLKFFSGVSLRQTVGKYFQPDQEYLRAGYIIIVGADGYRAVYSVSELFNRNDFLEALLYDKTNQDGGRFAVFMAMDFFSDRSVKAIKDIIINRSNISRPL
ncbi:MAG: hypothetical protein QHH43_03170 [Candidatus Saccharicenans sp.]|nr:hypothetical protein [Candidatus Saccharicenans sp.]